MPKPKKPQKPKMGRPPLADDLKKSQGLGIRVRPELRIKLDEAAVENRRSLTSEISDRLERSFQAPHGGQALNRLIELIAWRIKTIGHDSAKAMFGEEVPDEQWLSDPYCFDSVIIAVLDTLWERRPSGTPMSDDEMFRRLKPRLAQWEGKRKPLPQVNSGWKEINEKDWES